jgi:glyoxylase-like metal-dependent hydrolase (beta-lactamase superfamily II)
MKPYQVCKDVYQVGGSEISHPYDCSVYLLDAGDLVLIDSGAGESYETLIKNIRQLGFKPENIKTVLVTHKHIDHIGGLFYFRDDYGASVIAHEFDAESIRTGKDTGADVYGIPYIPCTVDVKLTGHEQTLQLGKYALHVVHIPGHTPGSIAVYVEIDGRRVLFGQDIHGPYNPAWGADPVAARSSLQKLLGLKADILCEGHFGIYQPADEVQEYINEYWDMLKAL